MARSANRVDVQLKAPRSESQRNKLVRDHTDVLSKGSSIPCQSMGLCGCSRSLLEYGGATSCRSPLDCWNWR